jgi:hypothetical protein
MALASARPFSAPPAAPATLRGLAEDLVDLRERLCAAHGILAGDYLLLKALVETAGADIAELASAAHASHVGALAGIGRLHGAGLARLHGKGDDSPVVTDSGRQLVADVDGMLEETVEVVIGTLSPHEAMMLASTLEACRTVVWDHGAAAVVSVLLPPES